MLKHFDLKQDINLFNESIQAYESMLYIPQPDTLEKILSLYELTTGKLWRFNFQSRSCNESKSLELISEMGALYHFISCLLEANVYLIDSRFIIPASISKQNDLIRQSSKLTPLFTDLKERLDHAYQTFPKNDRLTSIHILILNRLSASICKEIIDDGCQIFNKKISLTPIRKLQIAWSTHFSNKYFNRL